MNQQRPEGYLFIDAGYLRKAFQAVCAAVGVAAPARMHWDLWPAPNYMGSGPTITRTFYYDAPPPQAPGEAESEYASRLIAFEEECGLLASKDCWFVSSGYIRGRGKRARQKAVDIQIAVDMMSHSVRGNMSEAILLTGDLDFKPVVDAVVALGTKVTLWCEPKSASEELLRAADRRRTFSVDDMVQLLPRDDRERYRYYGHGGALGGGGFGNGAPQQIAVFTLPQGQEVRIHKAAKHYRVLIEDKSRPFDLGGTYWMHEDLEYLLRCVAYERGLALPQASEFLSTSEKFNQDRSN